MSYYFVNPVGPYPHVMEGPFETEEEMLAAQTAMINAGKRSDNIYDEEEARRVYGERLAKQPQR